MCKQRPERLSADSVDSLAFPRERFHTKAHAFGKLGAPVAVMESTSKCT